MPIPLGILAVAGAGAAGGGAAFDLLETTVLGSNTASVTFSSLGSYSNYKHLQLRITGRSHNASTNLRLVALRLNSDSGSNYAYHDLFGQGISVSSGALTPASLIPVISINGSTSTANAYGAAVVDLLDFSNSSKNTTIRSLTGMNDDNQPIYRIMLRSGVWLNTSAVTSITLEDFLGGFNWAAGSRFSLYGVK